MRKFIILVGLFGCQGVPDEDSPASGAQRFALEGFESCDALEDYLKDTILEALERQFIEGYGYGYSRFATEELADEAAAAEGEGEASGGGAGGGGLTGTNVQEAGVDEADFVKTDSEFIYVIHGRKLVILHAFPAAETEIVSTTDLEGYPSQLFVRGDYAVVFAWDEAVVSDLEVKAAYWVGGYSARLRVTVFDIADRTSPTVTRTSLIDGDLIGTRMVGDSVRIVTSFTAPIAFEYADPGIPYPECYDKPVSSPDEPDVAKSEPVGADADAGAGAGAPPDADMEADAQMASEGRREGLSSKNSCEQQYLDYWNAVAQATLDANRKRITAMTLEDLLPTVVTSSADTETTQQISQCESFFRTSVFTGYGLVSVSTIDLSAPTETLDATTVLGNWGTIYASLDQLYLAMPQYLTWNYAELPPEGEAMSWTAIHQFDIGSDPQSVGYVASGGVEGWLNNQFSMDEHEGRLRIATTVDRFTADWSSDRDNTFSVLEPDMSGLLVTVGSIEGIAPDEQIMAVRIFDDRGYLVTFRQVDPLFALDLTDPVNPSITGELEIPGFSQYVHPLGDDHLLTVGTALSKDGAWLGSQLSIFDVSDASAPALSHQEFLGMGQSEAQYDHKALTFQETTAGEGILALPMTDWSSYEGATLLVYDVSATSGFNQRGEVSHADLYADDPNVYCYWRDVRRGILSEDHVYSISTAGYMVNQLSGMEAVTSGVFPETELCGYYEEDYEGGTTVEGKPGTVVKK